MLQGALRLFEIGDRQAAQDGPPEFAADGGIGRHAPWGLAGSNPAERQNVFARARVASGYANAWNAEVVHR